MAAEATAEDIETKASITDCYKTLKEANFLESSKRNIISPYSDQPSRHPRHTMKGSVLLASSAFFLSQFIVTTFATPIESHVGAPLIARQKGTYSGTDANVNESLTGTYNCFRGGTWARQTELDTPIKNVCGESVYEVPEFTPFSLTPNADGAYSPQASNYQLSLTCFDVSTGCDDTPIRGTDYVYFTADLQTATHANMGDCDYALGRVRELCHGDNGWTRGGWFTFIDGTSYGLDPTRNYKNQ